MIEFYPQIKLAHIGLALSSGTLFALRGAGVLAGMHWPNWTTVRMTSYAVDTALLTAALMLLSILPGAMYANGWLVAKLVLLVAYIGFGVMALKRARTSMMRLGFYLAALLTFGMMYSIARAHHPLGFLYRIAG